MCLQMKMDKNVNIKKKIKNKKKNKNKKYIYIKKIKKNKKKKEECGLDPLASSHLPGCLGYSAPHTLPFPLSASFFLLFPLPFFFPVFL